MASEWTVDKIEALMAKATPGSWVYVLGFITSPKAGYTIAQTWSKREEDFQNAESNGNLIAAAPEIIRFLLDENAELKKKVCEALGTTI